MHRALVLLAAFVLAACQASPPATSTANPDAPSVPPASPPPSPDATATAAPPSLGPLPVGRILFQRTAMDMERYFTINTDGSEEQFLFERRGCGCARWSADGEHILTLDETKRGTFWVTTYRPDGTGRNVLDNPIKTLNGAVGAMSADGRRLVVAGWDETDSDNTGLYIASPDMSDLRQVLPVQEGMLFMEPVGITPDGSKIVFFGETGPDGGTTHAGGLWVVAADGSGLRQLTPPGVRVGFVDGRLPGSLSPEGRQLTFNANNAAWVVDLDAGEARRITMATGFVWTPQWSPAGDWITFTRFRGSTTAIALVRPDGTEEHEITAFDEEDEAIAAVWSPDGRHLLVARHDEATPDDQRDLWIMDLDGNYLGRVAQLGANFGSYSWAPTGE